MDSRRGWLAGLVGLAGLTGCGGGGAAERTGPAGAAPALASVVVSPSSLALSAGETRQILISARDASGADLPGPYETSLISSNVAVASVSGTGVVTAIGAGRATISVSVTLRGTTRQATLDVQVTGGGEPPAAGNVVNMAGTSFLPPTLTIAAGDSVTWRFAGATHNVTFGIGLPAGGNIPDQAPGSSVTRVFPAAGTFPYECTRHAGMTGTIVVQGSAPAVFTSVKLTPSSPAISLGQSVSIVATGLDQTGSPMTGLPLAGWVVSDPTKATVANHGIVTAVAPGVVTVTATITASGVSRSGTATVTVTDAGPAPNTITTPSNTFSPASLTIRAGETVTWQFSGAVHNVTWFAAQPPGGNLPDQQPGNAQQLTFPTPGTYAFECTRHAGMTGQIIVQGGGTAVFTSVTVTPPTASLTVGGSTPLSASGRDQVGNAMAGLPGATWTSSAPGVATVSATGTVSAVAAGSATVTATIVSGGVSKTGTANITVAAAPPGGAIVTTPGNSFSPSSVTIQAGGVVTWQISGSTHNVTFSGTGPTGGNIPDTPSGNSASRTFPNAGTYAYQCTRHSGMTGQVIVQSGTGGTPGGTQTFSSVAVSPASVTVAPGSVIQLTATALDQAGQPMTGLAAPAWTSGDLTKAVVSATGAVTGVSVGTVTMTASMTNGATTRTASATVTVSTTPPGSVLVTTSGQRFSPETVEIAPGGSVTWEFSATHNVTFTGPKPPGGNIPDTPAGRVSRTFTAAGDYDYECSIHKDMKGRVRVR